MYLGQLLVTMIIILIMLVSWDSKVSTNLIIIICKTPCHINYTNTNIIINIGLLRLESLNNLYKLNIIIVSWTTCCHNDDNINNDSLSWLESLNNVNKNNNIITHSCSYTKFLHLTLCIPKFSISVIFVNFIHCLYTWTVTHQSHINLSHSYWAV